MKQDYYRLYAVTTLSELSVQRRFERQRVSVAFQLILFHLTENNIPVPPPVHSEQMIVADFWLMRRHRHTCGYIGYGKKDKYKSVIIARRVCVLTDFDVSPCFIG